MRLICPNCDAQYEIDPDLVPPGGRDVECSSCGKLWFQTKEQPAAPNAGDDGPILDSPELIAPSRRLNESVLAVLREESARELRARKIERNEAPETEAFQDELPDPAPADITPASTQPKPPTAQQPATSHPADRPVVDSAKVVTDRPETLPDRDLKPQQTVQAVKLAEPSDPNRQAPTENTDKIVISEPATSAAATAGSGRYAAGFIVALAVIGGVAGLYLAAPQLPQDSALGQIAHDLRGWADQGRMWLHQHLPGTGTDQL